MSNDSVIRFSVDASGVEAGVAAMTRSNAAYMASLDALAERTRITQAAIDEAAANGSAASAKQIKALTDSITSYAATVGKTKGQQLELKAANAGVLDTMQPLIDSIKQTEAAMKSASATTSLFAESEDQAAFRISAMVKASLEASAAIADNGGAAAKYAAAVDELAAAATAAEQANMSFAASSEAVAVAQVQVATQVRIASTEVSAGAAKVAEALGRQLTALTATEAQMAVYDAQMAGYTESEVAQIGAIASEIELRKQQIAMGEKMAAAYAVETAAAKGTRTATAGLTNEIGVLGREFANGNYSRMAGSFTRLLSLAGYMQVVFNPITISLGALGGAMLYVANQNAKMNEALVLTGSYAGVTSDELRSMATAATVNGASFGTAAEAVTELAAQGRLTGAEIADLGKTTADMATYTSVSVKTMVDDFTKLSDEPVKASVKLNDQYHYLTVSTYDQIVALEKQGDATGAAQVAVEAFSKAMDERTQDIAKNEGVILSGWRDIKTAITGAIEAVGRFGAVATPGEVVARLQANKAARAPIGQWDSQDEDELQKAIGTMQAAEKTARDKASSDRAAQQVIDAKNAYDTWNKQFATPAQKRAMELQKYLDTIATPLGLSAGQQLADEDKINSKYKDHKAPRVDESGINDGLKDLKGQFDAREKAMQTSIEHIKSLEQQGVIDAREAIQQEHDARAAAYQDELKLVDQYIELAKGKKQQAALIEFQHKKDAMQTAIKTNDDQMADARAALQQKELKAAQAYTLALDNELQQRADAINATSAGRSLGSIDQDELSRITEVGKEVARKYTDLVKSLTENKISTSQFDDEVGALQAYQAKRIALEQYATDQIKAMNADWSSGAIKSLKDYADTASNKFQQVGSLVSDISKGMEDAITTFVTTGKLSFSSFATSVIADIARIQARALVAQAASGLSSWLSGLFSVGTSLAGGLGSSTSAAMDVSSGSYYTPSSAIQFHADGGLISGPGTGTSDSILARLSNGEGVLTAKTVERIGGGNAIDALNNGASINGLARFATGGVVGSSPSVAPVSQGSTNVQIAVNANGSGGPSFDDSDAQWLQSQVQKLVDSRLAQKMKGQGGYAWRMQYGTV